MLPENETERTTALHTLIEAFRLFLNADSVLFYPYNSDKKEWEPPLSATVSKWGRERRRPDRTAFYSALQRILTTKQPYWWADLPADLNLQLAFWLGFGQEIISAVGLPILVQDKVKGVLLIGYSSPQHFTPDERARIELFADEVTKVFRAIRFTRIKIDSVEIESPNSMRVRMTLPFLLTIDEYFDNVADQLWAIEFIYLVFALVNSGDLQAIKEFIALLGEPSNHTSASRPQVRALLASTSVEPLRLVSAHYGSPASFDLLGIGKIVEVLRDTIKDLLWRAKHEKQMAELERQSKEEEINKTRLETEKILLDIAVQKLEVIEKASHLKLPDNDKKAIIAALLPQMAIIASPTSMPLLKSRSVPRPMKGKAR